ncbi:hypothetical protein BDR26DRAFT_931042 [Obelidium mucronatum]|nr:hypothetical protein BDR26DRAFT_931042 [Obelidium mucronatum]
MAPDKKRQRSSSAESSSTIFQEVSDLNNTDLSCMEPAPPNKLLPLLIHGVRDPQSSLHVFNRDTDAFRLLLGSLDFKAWGLVVFPEQVAFPPPLRDEITGEPADFHVNMMPFMMMNPDPTLDTDVLYRAEELSFNVVADALPPKCKRYAPMIATCLRRCGREWGKVGYLTIHESFVDEGNSQRRGGLHIESPGNLVGGPDLKAHAYHRWYCWGGGKFGTGIEGDLDRYGRINVEGGIFVASSLDDTCQAWNCLIREHGDVTYPLGNIEHMRDAIGGKDTAVKLKANQLAWITDRTPHESLKLQKPGFRQFFRLVTSELSLWYSEHNSENELGTKPGCDVFKGNKFE